MMAEEIDVKEDPVIEEVITDEKVETSEADELAAAYDAAQEVDEISADEKIDAVEAEDAPVEGIQADGVIGEAPAETVAVDPPASWPEDAKAKWAGVDPELQQTLLQREANWKQAEDQIKGWMKAYEPIEAALGPMRQQLELQGVEPGQYVRQLIAADQFLRTNPQEAVKWIATQYGADLSQVEPADTDPTLTPLVQEISSLKTQLTGMQTAQQQAETARMSMEVENFAKDKPHFEKVRAQMGGLIQGGAAQDLQTAYDMAVWSNPETRAAMLAEQSVKTAETQKEEAAKKAAKARRITVTNLASKGASNGGQVFESLEEELGAVYDAVQGAS